MRRLALVLLCLASATAAEAYRSETGNIVRPLDESRFVVEWGGRSGAPAFWCAAGEYVTFELNLPPATRIYRYSAPVRRQGEGIVFGFDRDRATATGLARIVGGRSVTAAHARSLCRAFQR